MRSRLFARLAVMLPSVEVSIMPLLLLVVIRALCVSGDVQNSAL